MTKRALLLAFAVLMSAEHSLAQPAGTWPMFRGNAAHHGRTAISGPELPSIRWAHPLLESSYSSPAVGPDGSIYVGSADALYAITPDGDLLWSTSLDDFSISSPALGRNMVYSGSTSGTLYAFSQESGALEWSFATNDEIWSSPTLGPDGVVFVASSDNTVYAIDGATGQERWRYTMTTEVFSSPALESGVLCVVDQDGVGVLLNTQDGSLRATFSLQTEVVSSPAFGPNGLVVVAGTEGSLYGIDAETGDSRWQANLGGELVSSPAIGLEGSIYIGSSSGHLFAVDGDNGSVRWSTPLGDEVYGSPLLDAANRLYVGTVESERTSGTLKSVDAASGGLVWSLTVDSPIWSSASVDEGGSLFVATAGDENLSGQLLAIEHSDVAVDPTEEPVAGTEFTVDISASSTFTPTSGTIFYRRGGERTFESADVTPAGDAFQAVVPGSFITERGLEYYVSLSDGEVTRTYPATDPGGRPSIQRVRVPSAQLPLSLRPRRYHMVSVPLDAEPPNPAEILSDDYGPYNTNIWRLFRWGGNAYAEFPDLGADFAPGIAFFLAHRTGAPFTVGGRSVDTSDPAAVTLAPGWNQIAVPFAFPVNWNAVTTVDPVNADDVREIAFYDGVEMIQDVDALNPLLPWTGYFVRNSSSQPVDIVFPNVEASAAQEEETTARLAKGAASSAGYVLRLSAYSLSDHLRDTQNWIGFVPGAMDQEDALDIREAPPFDEHLRLSVIDADARFARNYKPAGTDGAVWHLELSKAPTSDETVEVQLSPEGTIPDGFETTVIDDDLNRSVAVIDQRFRVDLRDSSMPRRLRIVVGTPEFVSARLDGIKPHPAAFFLDASYPNPFSATTAIRYGLEKATDVSLEVFDVMGRRVVTLLNGSHRPGRYETHWSGLDSAGRTVANGLYFYRLRAGSFVATRQVVLSR